jgi:hypothetical protein
MVRNDPAYPHDISRHELVKKEHTLTDFAKSVESCDTRFHLSLYGGKMPGYEDIAPYKIGEYAAVVKKCISSLLTKNFRTARPKLSPADCDHISHVAI